MECNDALEALTEPNADQADEARAHVTTCPACLSRFDQLALAVLSMDEDEITCAECRAQLPAYLEVEAQAEQVPAELSPVAGHLARCPYCAEEYRALREAMAAWDAGTLPEPAQPVTFDLSFASASLSKSLETAAAAPSLWVAEAAGQVRELFSEIVVTLQASAAAFGAMPSPLVPSPVPARAFRAEGDEAQAQVLVLPDPGADVSIELSVGPVSEDAAAIALNLNRIEDGEPLPDTRVMLYTAERHLLAGSVTESDGSIVFRSLRLGRYIVQVRRNDQRWELPVVIVAM